jgi:predicted nucleic acid-binding protein
MDHVQTRVALADRRADRAGQFLRHHTASDGTDDFDAVIAATADHHGLRLATLNVKPFPMFAALNAAYSATSARKRN